MAPKNNLIGVQGGKGSFNELAANHYLKDNPGKYKIEYLYTSERVLEHVTNEKVALGLFAIHNTLGGLVEESLRAMGRYNFQVVEKITLPIRHNLMKRKDVLTSQITTIMAHPQVLLQCEKTLAKKFPELKTISGSGDMIDTALVAKALSDNHIPSNIAVLGPESLSKLYDFDTIAKNLQDSKENITTFLLVKKIISSQK